MVMVKNSTREHPFSVGYHCECRIDAQRSVRLESGLLGLPPPDTQRRLHGRQDVLTNPNVCRSLLEWLDLVVNCNVCEKHLKLVRDKEATRAKQSSVN